MAETYIANAIVLQRRAWREDDVKAVFYAKEHGRLELVVKGAKKISSKMAGHIEPMNYARIMVVRGRQYDYAGNAHCFDCFSNIKADPEKTMAAGEMFRIFIRAVKDKQPDQPIFDFLHDYLDGLNQLDMKHGRVAVFSVLSILKLSAIFGYAPALSNCVKCRAKIQPNGNFFNPASMGLYCPACSALSGLIPISAEAIKAVRFAERSEIKEIRKLRLNQSAVMELKRLSSLILEQIM